MVQEIRRARLIYNPTSGREEMRRRLPDILQKLDLAGIETTAHATVGAGDATASTIEAIERGVDLIIAAGGDGTLNEVINGMASMPNRPPLGILPVGTTNDFARAMNIPRSWNEACDIIIENYRTPIDLGLAGDRYFINIAGGGSLTELTYEVPIKLKTMIGQLAYYVKGLEKMTRLRPSHLRIRADGVEEFNEEFMLFLITNSNSIGGFDKLAPDASIDDGLFDVLLVKKCNLAEFIRVASLALRGEHMSDPHVVHFRTDQLEVTSPELVQLNLDGELGGALPCSFSVLPGHIEIFVKKS